MSIPFRCSLFALALASLPTLGLLRAQDAQTTPADGQNQPDQPASQHMRGRSEHMIQQLQAKLGLSEDQVQQIEGIFKTQFQQMKALRGDDSLSDDDRRAKMMALRQSVRGQIRSILTPDQQKTFDTLPSGGRPHGPPPGGEGPPSSPPPTT